MLTKQLNSAQIKAWFEECSSIIQEVLFSELCQHCWLSPAGGFENDINTAKLRGGMSNVRKHLTKCNPSHSYPNSSLTLPFLLPPSVASPHSLMCRPHISPAASPSSPAIPGHLLQLRTLTASSERSASPGPVHQGPGNHIHTYTRYQTYTHIVSTSEEEICHET